MEYDVSRKVGTAVMFENDRVRIWEMVLEPGESSELHHHDHDYLFVYVTEDNLLQVHILDEETSPTSFEDGYTQFNIVGSAGLTHCLENVGDRTHRQVIVELLGGSISEQAQPPESNGRRR